MPFFHPRPDLSRSPGHSPVPAPFRCRCRLGVAALFLSSHPVERAWVFSLSLVSHTWALYFRQKSLMPHAALLRVAVKRCSSFFDFCCWDRVDVTIIMTYLTEVNEQVQKLNMHWRGFLFIITRIHFHNGFRPVLINLTYVPSWQLVWL